MSKKTTNDGKGAIERGLSEGKTFMAARGKRPNMETAKVLVSPGGYILKISGNVITETLHYTSTASILVAMRDFAHYTAWQMEAIALPRVQASEVIALDVTPSNTRNIIGKTSAVERDEIVEVRKTRSGKRG